MPRHAESDYSDSAFSCVAFHFAVLYSTSKFGVFTLQLFLSNHLQFEKIL